MISAWWRGHAGSGFGLFLQVFGQVYGERSPPEIPAICAPSTTSMKLDYGAVFIRIYKAGGQYSTVDAVCLVKVDL